MSSEESKDLKTYQCIYASKYSFGSWEVQVESEEEAEFQYNQRFAGRDCDLFSIIEGDQEKATIATYVAMTGHAPVIHDPLTDEKKRSYCAKNSGEKRLDNPKKSVRNPLRAIMAAARRYMHV